MAAADVGCIGRGIFLVDLNIGQQARARVTALDQVMAEDGVVREARGHRALEGIHLVDALADERSLAEYILVHVGNRARVGVDAGIATEQSRIVRARGAGQADADARLQDAVAIHDQAPGAALRAIERMFHRADEFRRRFPGQLGIRIQGDDVAGALQLGDVAHHAGEALPGVAAQQGVEVAKLATLALVAHPGSFPRVPASRAVEQEETIAVDAGIAGVQFLDAARGARDKFFIIRHRCLWRIKQVGQQAIQQVLLAVGQVTHFQRFGQLIHAARA